MYAGSPSRRRRSSAYTTVYNGHLPPFGVPLPPPPLPPLPPAPMLIDRRSPSARKRAAADCTAADCCIAPYPTPRVIPLSPRTTDARSGTVLRAVMSHGDRSSTYAHTSTANSTPILTFDKDSFVKGRSRVIAWASAAADSNDDCVRPRGADRGTGSRVPTVVDLGNARGRRSAGCTCCCCRCR